MANKSNTDGMQSEHSLFTLHTNVFSFGLNYYTLSSTMPAPIRLIWVGTSWKLILNIVCVLLLRISWLWGRRFCPKSQVFWNLKGPSPFVAVSLVIFHICRVFGWRMQMGACCSWATTKKTLILEAHDVEARRDFNHRCTFESLIAWVSLQPLFMCTDVFWTGQCALVSDWNYVMWHVPAWWAICLTGVDSTAFAEDQVTGRACIEHQLQPSTPWLPWFFWCFCGFSSGHQVSMDVLYL